MHALQNISIVSESFQLAFYSQSLAHTLMTYTKCKLEEVRDFILLSVKSPAHRTTPSTHRCRMDTCDVICTPPPTGLQVTGTQV